MSISIMILCSDGPHHGFMVRSLTERFDVTRVFCEPESAQCKRLRKRKRYTDYAWRIYHNSRRRLLGLSHYRECFFGGNFLKHTSKLDNISKVNSVNDRAVIAHAEGIKPDIIVVIGTSIIGKKLLALDIPILNVHGGYLPDYKGNHCFFFAYLDGALDRVGSTLHLIDPGVDTGAIIEQVPVRVEPGDVPESSYCKAEMKAIRRLPKYLNEFEQTGKISSFEQSDEGKVFRTRDRNIRHELRLWRRLGRLVPGDFDEVTRPTIDESQPIKKRDRRWL